MKILCLWISNYYSGSTDERFLGPLKELGHDVRLLPLESPSVEAELLKIVEEWKPNVLLHVPYRDSIRSEIIRHISFNTYTATVSWNGDDEWLFATDPGHAERNKAYNWCVTTHEAALQKYKESDYDRVILSQWGFDQQIWKQSKKTKKKIEVYFCGARTPERDRYIRNLRDEGIAITFEGAGYSKEKISLAHMVNRYKQSKIALNFTLGVKGDHVYTQVKARNFEIPAIGSFNLSEQAGELNRFFDTEKEIKTFKDSAELIKKIKYFLKHEEEREKIAAAGNRAARAYSYQKIFQRVLGLVTPRGVK